VNRVLKPGTFKSKCGLFGYIALLLPNLKEKTASMIDAFTPLPTPGFLLCEDEYLSYKSDGTITLMNVNHESFMILSGSADICSSDDTSCVNGLVMKEDKTLEVNGKAIKQALVLSSHQGQKLSPWPFEEEPKKLQYKTGSSKDF